MEELFRESRYVFIAVVGPTSREPSIKAGVSSYISASLDVVEVLKGDARLVSNASMKLAQSDSVDSCSSGGVFVWYGDWLLVFSETVSLTEEDFWVGCNPGTIKIGNNDYHSGHDDIIERLRNLGVTADEG